MKTIIIATLLLIAVASCNRGDQVDNVSPANSAEFVATDGDLAPITQGKGLPQSFLDQDKLVEQALLAYAVTLTPQKAASLAFGADSVKLTADVQSFMNQWVKDQPSLTGLANGRSAAASAPSPMVVKIEAYTDSKLDLIESQVNADQISEENAKTATGRALAENYNMIYSLPAYSITESERQNLLASHRSGFNQMSPAEEVLKKLQPASPNGRATTGWWHKLRKMLLRFARQLVKASITSFVSGCSDSGSASRCVQSGLNRAQSELGQNTTSSINTAINTTH